ncbi:glycoside hydrolase family 35 protein [Thermothelomyces thermophilus ATCC 42464]|uniref:beta-galactosidase n=1 Tax=Thermothelomyces thermophilus (strain ATCC 42464 / BCRC 31852 / DSM 1799) TaxID=573729 RepID=G2QAA1_THET4|nr:glycoside hydrolase family 35 protein [Thermothelomyces thermophilus ATCC 42464]AEO56651.1 glycoside hydrolase family 35 protein [Thermothelomyces thermophilus ATCC 42464]
MSLGCRQVGVLAVRLFCRLYGPGGLSAWIASFTLLSLLSSRFGSCAVASSSGSSPILDNGLQHEIQWDRHSIVIGGDRLFLFGGEMHPFRLPVPELWEGILQKIKAMGLRMVSIYIHWGFHAPAPGKAVREGENVLLVVHDDTGHDQLNAAVNPRRALNATLLGGGAVAGTAGGSAAPDRAGLDRVRTRYNEGGLAAERLGWHLRGFNDSAWETAEGPWLGSRAPACASTAGGCRWTCRGGSTCPSRSALKPAEEDVERGTLEYTVLLFPSIASEDTFPVPPGVLDYSGDNLIGLAVWSLQEEGARVDVDVVVGYVADSSLDVKFDGSYLRPGWDPRRLSSCDGVPVIVS